MTERKCIEVELPETLGKHDLFTWNEETWRVVTDPPMDGPRRAFAVLVDPSDYEWEAVA